FRRALLARRVETDADDDVRVGSSRLCRIAAEHELLRPPGPIVTVLVARSAWPHQQDIEDVGVLRREDRPNPAALCSLCSILDRLRQYAAIETIFARHD